MENEYRQGQWQWSLGGKVTVGLASCVTDSKVCSRAQRSTLLYGYCVFYRSFYTASNTFYSDVLKSFECHLSQSKWATTHVNGYIDMWRALKTWKRLAHEYLPTGHENSSFTRINKKLFRRWDSERELFTTSSTTFKQCTPKATEFSEIMQN